MELKRKFGIYSPYHYLVITDDIVPNGRYTAVILSLLLHALMLAFILLTKTNKQSSSHDSPKKVAINSYLYHAPKRAAEKANTFDMQATQNASPPAPTEAIKQSHALSAKAAEIIVPTLDIEKQPVSKAQAISKPTTEVNKLSAFSQLQTLRQTLKQNSATKLSQPPKNTLSPSIFNPHPTRVPHSVPLKDAIKAREQSTKKLGAGIVMSKGDNGVCSITQDLSAFGLTEGSSTQYFNCGESKFEKNFRRHMQNVNAKLTEQ
ncbi:hypothetical protein SAMN05216262_1245 [Colwellia chukchiensis]|uniref:Uncharacterized protein n=1 Tax=Colwellia chukchiensis TaxID=641665 RepID=A0A1H7TBW8_9GAMM|nr:hypothetical protein [Colwellia chukchiensis]SEL82015.1 hypothetical protein SAMN05216262_1245 [Colwellia chukchiensis]